MLRSSIVYFVRDPQHQKDIMARKISTPQYKSILLSNVMTFCISCMILIENHNTTGGSLDCQVEHHVQ